ncbi:UNVERIFIED_CONTAM: hypothetical protein HDU68_004684 [Siphonaria sp. JEL0065]|nr:hypothetical protein HDU68_004684 [Siphonaria sp. JEL0065]
MATTLIRPSQTLYVRQVCEKASKKELKVSLYHLFSQHGAVIDVVVCKTAKMRGQAFVVFRDVAAATAAMRALQGFPFFERALKIEFAATKSNAVSVLEGVAPPKKSEKEKKAAAAAVSDAGGSAKRAREDNEDEDEGSASNTNDEKKRKTEVEQENDDNDDDVDMEEDDDDDEETTENPAAKILFLTSLPSQITADGPDALTTLFKDYKGFKEVRLIPGKPDLAFVEYATVDQAAEAKKRLDGFSIMQGRTLKIQYAKA